jgi:hypothetical protein
MPIDRPNRDRAAKAIAAYLRGEVDNFKLDDETLSLRTKDRTLIDISLDVWHLYDDIKRHKVHCTPEGWDFLTRCIAFLRSDAPARTKISDSTIEFSPFSSVEDWNLHRHHVSSDRLPAYDPATHQFEVWGPIFGAKVTIPWLLGGIVVIVALLIFFCRP